MNTQHLFQNENILLTTDDHSITLTNRRIRHTTTSMGEALIVSIHLEKISSIEIQYKSWIIFLIGGIIALISGIYQKLLKDDDTSTFFLSTCLLCLLIFFFTGKHIVTVASDGGTKINILTKGMSRESVLDFVNKIEEAKSLL